MNDSALAHYDSKDLIKELEYRKFVESKQILIKHFCEQLVATKLIDVFQHHYDSCNDAGHQADLFVYDPPQACPRCSIIRIALMPANDFFKLTNIDIDLQITKIKLPHKLT
jgi:hypothetical protein